MCLLITPLKMSAMHGCFTINPNPENKITGLTAAPERTMRNRVMQSFLVIAAVLVAITMFNPQPAFAAAKSGGVAHQAHSTATGNSAQIRGLNARMAAAEAELARLKGMRQRIVRACSDLPADVACDSELQAAKAELRVEITRLEQQITTTDQANRAWTTQEITAAEQRLNAKLNEAKRAREELARDVNAAINDVNERWRFGGQLGLGAAAAMPVPQEGIARFIAGGGVHGGLCFERKSFGMGLQAAWESASSGDLSGSRVSALAYAYARRDKGMQIGGGMFVPEMVRLQDAEQRLSRVEMTGVAPVLYVGKRLDIAGSTDIRLDLSAYAGVSLHQVSAWSKNMGKGYNGPTAGFRATVVLGARKPRP